MKPIAYARKQDLLTYSPICALYANKPAPENGNEAVALFSEDQVLAIVKAVLEAAAEEGKGLYWDDFGPNGIADCIRSLDPQTLLNLSEKS